MFLWCFTAGAGGSGDDQQPGPSEEKKEKEKEEKERASGISYVPGSNVLTSLGIPEIVEFVGTCFFVVVVVYLFI